MPRPWAKIDLVHTYEDKPFGLLLIWKLNKLCSGKCIDCRQKRSPCMYNKYNTSQAMGIVRTHLAPATGYPVKVLVGKSVSEQYNSTMSIRILQQIMRDSCGSFCEATYSIVLQRHCHCPAWICVPLKIKPHVTRRNCRVHSGYAADTHIHTGQSFMKHGLQPYQLPYINHKPYKLPSPVTYPFYLFLHKKEVRVFLLEWGNCHFIQSENLPSGSRGVELPAKVF